MPPWEQIAGNQCVLFIHNPSTERELWYWCEGGEAEKFLEGIGSVIDFEIAVDARLIFFTQPNNTGGEDIWMINNGSADSKRIAECGAAECGDIAYSETKGLLAYSRMDDEPIVKIIDLEGREIGTFLYSSADLEFSPDGDRLGFYDRNTGQLVILELAQGSVLSIAAQEGMTGGWSEDGKQLLYGAADFSGELPDVNVYALFVETGESELVVDSGGGLAEYYRPHFFRSTEKIISAVRVRGSGFTRQIWVYHRTGEDPMQITSDYIYDNSSLQLNNDYSRMVFQKFAPEQADSQPEVWLYDFDTGGLKLIAENAVLPKWILDE